MLFSRLSIRKKIIFLKTVINFDNSFDGNWNLSVKFSFLLFRLLIFSCPYSLSVRAHSKQTLFKSNLKFRKKEVSITVSQESEVPRSIALLSFFSSCFSLPSSFPSFISFLFPFLFCIDRIDFWSIDE